MTQMFFVSFQKTFWGVTFAKWTSLPKKAVRQSTSAIEVTCGKKKQSYGSILSYSLTPPCELSNVPQFYLGFPGGSDGKESACNAEDAGSVPGSGRPPGGGNGNPLQYSCLKNSTDKEPGGYSSWGHKELDTTEQLTRLNITESYSKILSWLECFLSLKTKPASQPQIPWPSWQGFLEGAGRGVNQHAEDPQKAFLRKVGLRDWQKRASAMLSNSPCSYSE